MKRRIATPLLAGLVVGLALILAASGCATMQDSDDAPGDPEMLEREALTFHSNLRWARYEHAEDQVHDDYVSRFRGEYEERGDDFEIVDMRMRRAEMEEGGREAVIEVEQQWYELPSTVVESERFVERWVFEDGVWRMRERLRREEYRAMDETFDSERTAASTEDEPEAP